MGKCGIAKILFYAYSLILLVGYALFAVVNYHPPAQSIVLKEGARVKLSYVALQNSQPPLSRLSVNPGSRNRMKRVWNPCLTTLLIRSIRHKAQAKAQYMRSGG